MALEDVPAAELTLSKQVVSIYDEVRVPTSMIQKHLLSTASDLVIHGVSAQPPVLIQSRMPSCCCQQPTILVHKCLF